MKRNDKSTIVVEKRIFSTNRIDYEPFLFTIEVDEEHLMGLSEENFKLLYEKMGEFIK